MTSLLGFDLQYHGKNVTVTGGGKSATKIKKGQREAVVVSSRALYNNELFEVELGNEVDSMTSSGGSTRRKKTGTAGSIRIGVTGHRPADLWHNFPQTMKKMNSATWMLSGDDFLENGDITCTFTKHNLKELQIGEKVGVMRCPEFEGCLLFFINGECIGIMATSIPDKTYAFVELHGDCEKVTLTPLHSVVQENLPTEIREVRDKESDIRKHKKTVQEKEEVIQVLEKRIEELNAQIAAMQAARGRTATAGKRSAANSPQQTSQVNGSADGGVAETDAPATQDTNPNPPPPRRRQNRGGCTIL